MAKEPTEDALEFAAWLRTALDEEAKISVREAARRLAKLDKTGVETARGSIYKWLRADNTPSRQRRAEIGRALGVSYPGSGDRTIGGRLAALEAALLELVRDGAEFRREVVARLERLEQRSATEGRPSTARTAP